MNDLPCRSDPDPAPDPTPGASNQLRRELLALLQRYGQESDVTVYQAIGVLEIVKLDLVEILEAAREG